MKYKVKVVIPNIYARHLFKDGRRYVNPGSEKGIFIVESDYKNRIEAQDLLKQTGLTKEMGFPVTITDKCSDCTVEPLE